MAANPFLVPDLFDTFRLAGVVSPGQCDVTNGRSPRKWDVWRGFGLSGAATVFTGIDIKEFTAHIMFWNAEQYEEYQRNLVPILELPPRGTRPKALDFYHPMVSDPPINIRSVGVADVTQLQKIGDTGLFGVDIILIPYKPPKPTVSKPIASDDKPPSPQDELDKNLLEDKDTIKELVNQLAPPPK